MEPGPVSAEMRWTCVGIAVAGTLLLIAGVMLGFASQVLGPQAGKPTLGVVAGGLIVAGLFCGVLLIVASRPLQRAKPDRRRAAPPEQMSTGTVGPPGTSEEWIRTLRQ